MRYPVRPPLKFLQFVRPLGTPNAHALSDVTVFSDYARMESNWASGNGWGKQVWLWSAQLQVQNSRDVIVRNNTVFVSSGAATGICIVQQNRSCVGCGLPAPYGQWPQPAINNSVTDNTFIFDDCHGKVGEVADKFLMDLAQGGNRFDANSYHMCDSVAS